MKFLCLCYYDRKKFDALSKTEMEALGRQCQPHDEALRKSGHLILVGSLALPRSSKSLRPKKGKVSLTDGPYAEVKEPVGAFFIIEAHGLNEAVEIASLHPGAHLGEQLGWGIEVRPIDMFDQP